MFQANSINYQSIDPEILSAAEALKAGKIILIQTQTVWSLVCLLEDQKSFERLLKYKREDYRFNYECVVDSIERFKFYVPDLSPRVETLLSFHSRPLAILSNSSQLPNHLKQISPLLSFRLDNSIGISSLIQVVNQGLWVTSAFTGSDIEGNNFEQIGGKVKELADEIYHLKNLTNISGEEPVLVELDAEDNLEFLRD